MLDLKIAAVGSGPLIAREIADAVQYILAGSAGVDILCVADLPGARAYDLYVCSTSQLEKLQAQLPPEKIVLLALTPTAQFFISVARIPEGETIYIFNNYLEYTRILSRYCEALGIGGVTFRAVAYKEMAEEDVLARLSQARYLIGVDRFIDNVLRATPRYLAALPPDAKLIAARRVASVPTACALLRRIAAQTRRQVAASAQALRLQAEAGAPEAVEDLQALRCYASQALKLLQNAVIRSALSHVAPQLSKSTACGTAPEAPANDAPCSGEKDAASLLHAIWQCVRELDWMAEKLAER